MQTPLDQLWVVDIRRVEADRNRLGWICARCDEDHAPTKSWWVTFAEPDGATSTVAMCEPCWVRTRARLAYDVFGYAGATG